MELLVVEDLKTWFPIKEGITQRTIGHIKAVDGVNLRVRMWKDNTRQKHNPTNKTDQRPCTIRRNRHHCKSSSNEDDSTPNANNLSGSIRLTRSTEDRSFCAYGTNSNTWISEV